MTLKLHAYHSKGTIFILKAKGVRRRSYEAIGVFESELQAKIWRREHVSGKCKIKIEMAPYIMLDMS